MQCAVLPEEDKEALERIQVAFKMEVSQTIEIQHLSGLLSAADLKLRDEREREREIERWRTSP